MQITHLGHACFLLEGADGTRVLTDPCDPGTGYTIPPLSVDAVTVSHEHHDHSDTSCALGDPRILREAGEATVRGAQIRAFPCWHDEVQGKQRGSNLAFRVTMDGVTLLHLGDIGHLPSAAFCKAVGSIDILLCPVGGVYTIDATQAAQTVRLLAPRLVIPMHYRTPRLSFSLDTVEPFLACMSDRTILPPCSGAYAVTADALAQPSVLPLPPQSDIQKM